MTQRRRFHQAVLIVCGEWPPATIVLSLTNDLFQRYAAPLCTRSNYEKKNVQQHHG